MKKITLLILFLVALSTSNVYAGLKPLDPVGYYTLYPKNDKNIEIKKLILYFDIDKTAKYAKISAKYIINNNSETSEQLYVNSLVENNNTYTNDGFVLLLNDKVIEIDKTAAIKRYPTSFKLKAVTQLTYAGPVLESKSENVLELKYNQLSGGERKETSDLFIPEKYFYYLLNPIKEWANLKQLEIVIDIPSNYELVDTDTIYEMEISGNNKRRYSVLLNSIPNDILWLNLHPKPWYLLGLNTKEHVRYLIYILTLLTGIFLGAIIFLSKQSIRKPVVRTYLFIYLCIITFLCPFKNIFLYTENLFQYILYIAVASLINILSMSMGYLIIKRITLHR